MRRTSGAEGLIGTQALDLSCLHASLAGARTLWETPAIESDLGHAPGSSCTPPSLEYYLGT